MTVMFVLLCRSSSTHPLPCISVLLHCYSMSQKQVKSTWDRVAFLIGIWVLVGSRIRETNPESKRLCGHGFPLLRVRFLQHTGRSTAKIAALSSITTVFFRTYPYKVLVLLQRQLFVDPIYTVSFPTRSLSAKSPRSLFQGFGSAT